MSCFLLFIVLRDLESPTDRDNRRTSRLVCYNPAVIIIIMIMIREQQQLLVPEVTDDPVAVDFCGHRKIFSLALRVCSYCCGYCPTGPRTPTQYTQPSQGPRDWVYENCISLPLTKYPILRPGVHVSPSD